MRLLLLASIALLALAAPASADDVPPIIDAELHVGPWCELTGVGVVDTFPYVIVVVYENCIPPPPGS